MTPSTLADRLGALPGSWPRAEEPARLLRALEDAAERAPADRALAEAIQATNGLATADLGVPPEVAGVRRERVVRWDAHSVSWDGVQLRTGRPVRLRALRPHASRDPVQCRALARDGRALRDLVPGLESADPAWPALVAPLPGPSLGAAEGAHDVGPEAVLRLVAGALGDLGRWDAAGLGVPTLDPLELREHPDGLRVVCLTPGVGGDAGASIARVAELVSRWWEPHEDTVAATLLEGFVVFPPRDAHEAVHILRHLMVEDLTSRWHALVESGRRTSHRERAVRLHHLLTRIEHALPPPSGRGAVGVDMDGRISVVASDGFRVSWDDTVVRDATGILAAEAVRRLLRVRAASPRNPRLHAEVGGTEAFTEQVCHWLSSALQLRNLRKLLEASA